MKTKYFEFYSNGKLVKTVNRSISLSSKMLDIIERYSVDKIIVKRELSAFEIQFIHFNFIEIENTFIGVDEGSYYYYDIDMREPCRYGYRYELRLNNKRVWIKPIW